MAIGKKVLAVGAIVAFSFAVFAASQHPNAPTSQSYKSRPHKTDAVDMMKGTIKTVSRVQEPDGTKVHIVLETEKGDMKIIVGPASYLDRSKMSLQMGDKVTVWGHEVSANGEQMWLATKIEKNGHAMELRQNGKTNWDSNHNGNGRMNH